jgi:hypothetical protein
VNRARLEWHKERQRDTDAYFRSHNSAKMREWQEANAGLDRNDPDALREAALEVGERALRLLKASQILEGERREGALKRAGRFLREESALRLRADRLERGEKPLDEWAVCRCGSPFQPGGREGFSTYTQCYTCSSKEWLATSYTCIYCDRRHAMKFPLCFVCKLDRDEDDARFIRHYTATRDGYVCQICGIDAMETGAELQVGRLDPDGGNWPWNFETRCTPCHALVGKNFEKLDERAYWALVQNYATILYEYLTGTEREALRTLDPGSFGAEQIDFSRTPSWRTEDEVDEREGTLNVLTAFPGAALCR